MHPRLPLSVAALACALASVIPLGAGSAHAAGTSSSSPTQPFPGVQFNVIEDLPGGAQVWAGDLKSGYRRVAGADPSVLAAGAAGQAPVLGASHAGARGLRASGASGDAHSVTLVRATWAGGPALSAAPSFGELSTGMQQSAVYWSSQTQGRVRFRVSSRTDDVTVTAHPCGKGGNPGSFASQVSSAASYTQAAGTHIVIVFPSTSACSWAGLARTGSSLEEGGWVLSNGHADASVVGHELGHNLGLGHSQLADCSSGPVHTVVTGTCTQVDYGNSYSIMGTSFYGTKPGALDSYQLVRLGLVTPAILSASTKRVTLSPMGSSSQTRVASFTDHDGTAYTLEYRYPTGQDVSMRRVPSYKPVGVLVESNFSPAGVPAAGFKRTDQSYLLDADPAATRDAAKVGGGDNTLPVGQWVNINGAGVKVVSQDPHGATIAFAPRLGPVVLPSQAPGAVTLPTFDSLGRDAGTSMVRWDAGSEPGIWYGISMNSGRPTISRHGGTAVRKGLGFSKAVTWNTVACSDSGCILGPRSTASASIEPLRMAVSLGPVPGDGIGTLTVSGYKASAALGWRIYWCNQRISGPACNPYSSGAHGETSLRPGNRAVTIDLLHHKVEYGGTMITAIAGAGAYRSADVYNVGLAVTRVGDLVTTRGFENASSSIIYDWGSYRL